MWKNPDLVLKLAFLGVGVVVIVCLTILISCGHDGTLVDSVILIAAVVFGANVWTIGRSLKK